MTDKPKPSGGDKDAQDAKARERKRKTDEALDEGIEESFPASDPPAIVQPKHKRRKP